MAIKVTIPSGVSSVTIDPLYQWDYGQVLEIESPDFSSLMIEVHFSCAGNDTAVVHTCSVETDVAAVQIPDACFEQEQDITAWIYEISGTNGRTTKSVVIPLIARPRPSRPSLETTASENDAFAELVAGINDAVADIKSGKISVEKAKLADNASKADSATAATTAVTAQNANHANSATTAATAAKLSIYRYVVYVNMTAPVSNGEVSCFFSFVTQTTNGVKFDNVNTIASFMPEGMKIVSGGTITANNNQYKCEAVKRRGFYMDFYYDSTHFVSILTSSATQVNISSSTYSLTM